ncbi:MAG: 2-oxoacid:acceptor oxidoreductase subunit alpha [Spirochaetaceae bacterium]|nr:2-oxoacid:acceptor oxidoreductase subunit alpha [Spirochaetaceae bacterium]
MFKEISWKIGGTQGEGIEATGDLFSTGLNRLGYYLNAFRTFSSRVKGGPSTNKIRVSVDRLYSTADAVHILVAFDQEAIDLNYHEVVKEGIILADAKFEPLLPSGCGAKLLVIPFTDIAKNLGTPLMKNMVAVGASAALMGLDTTVFTEIAAEKFGRKGEAVVKSNIEAIKAGKAEVDNKLGSTPFKMEAANKAERLFITGNDIVGMGCIAGGARFMASYPITPATEIMEYLIRHLPKVGGAVVQTEDEISAVMMTIGAGYAGVRSVTNTSGPGLSLKAEGIGFAAMIEAPLVVVDVQRGGPSTGLPTRHEQSDIMAAIYNTHGDIPKIVLAPSTVEEAFYDTTEAFNLAEEFQCPVILIIDMQMGSSKQTVEMLNLKKVQIRRGALQSSVPAPADPTDYFKRYLVTESGVSPRVVPGMVNGIHHSTGVEHNEMGKPSEVVSNRINQMDKRLRKLKSVKVAEPVHINAVAKEADALDVLFVGFNSTRGAIEETVAKLNGEGVKAGHAHIRLIHPFPAEKVAPLVKKAKKIIIVENNATAQLAQIMKLEVGQAEKIKNILKYDGSPFLPGELYKKSKEVL